MQFKVWRACWNNHHFFNDHACLDHGNINMNEHDLLSGSTNPHLFIFPTCNGILIREVFWVKNSYANIIVFKCWFNQLHNLSFLNVKVEKVCSSFTNSNTQMMVISTNFKYSLNLWASNPLLLIKVHNLVIGLTSNDLAMALGACVVTISLNMDIYKSKMLTFKSSKISNNKCFRIVFFEDARVERKRNISIKMHLDLWIHNVQGIHQFTIWETHFQLTNKHLSCIRTLIFHLSNDSHKNISSH